MPDLVASSRSELTTRDKLALGAKHFELKVGKRDSIIAGYPWFTDWGRDTMISLPGICLASGDWDRAAKILCSYADSICDGLIPNRFVETGAEPEYNTVDATLWFINAIHQTLLAKYDRDLASRLHEVGKSIVAQHVRGTRYGIKVDDDGLLKQGGQGLQLTWMDAKVGDWVVTPRHGKPVEVNGLWINALRVLEWLGETLDEDTASLKALAERAETSFSLKFWSDQLGFFLDTVDPDDGSLRPNQVIAMGLPFGPAIGDNARRALDRVERDLLTPVGLRTLGPEEPAYRGRFKGSLPELDSAYHQGTVWPWLLGPYSDAVMRLTGDRARVARALEMVPDMLEEYGLGGIAEVYDGDAPHTAGGCPWQAWSIAEILRVWDRYVEN